MRNYKNILIKKYEEFEIEEHQAKKKLLRSEVFSILNGEDNLGSEDFHIWGLTYYMSDDDEYNINLALEKFLYAYELDSSNFLACLYIAHCYHDKGDFNNALKYYELVDGRKLKEFQIWRYVKLIEQIGFCNYKLGNKKLGRQQFRQVLKWYRRLPKEDRVVPTEILQCLPKSDEIVIEIKEIEDYSG